MTASLPLPDDDRDAAPGVSGLVPPLPAIPAAEAAAAAPRRPSTRPVKTAGKKPRKAVPPPKPPIPASVAAAQFVAAEPVGALEEPAPVAGEPVTEDIAAPGPARVSPPLIVPPVPPLPVLPEPEPEPEPVFVLEPDLSEATDAETTAAAVRLSGVTKVFGATRAVDAIDLTIPAGTFYGIVGPNGAGKTTTLSMIAGLLRPDAGRIEVGGVDLARHPARAKKLMGVLPDRLRTFDRLTGRQLLHYYGVLRGIAPGVVASRTADLARAFDLTAALGRAVSDYSAGMTKKVMLAGAMIHSPRVLILDEPFEAVDPVSSAVILDILAAYVDHGGTVVLSSHGMEFVERVCTGIAVIVGGQVLAEGTVAQVRGELTLEQRFVELAGGLSDVEGLEWLHTFSG